jgi:hypothetical protein
MPGYNRRDQIGHWVRTTEPQLRPCHHACCRGYRAHPSNWPVIPAKMAYRTATDEQLARHYARVSAIENDRQARGAELQIIAEFERRDRREARRREAEARRAQAREARASAAAVKRTEAEVERERIRVDAEAVTRGNLVNRKGRALGIHPDEILTGRQAVFDRYASDEAKDYFASTPRPTAAYFRTGRDTRYVERASAPKRRRRGLVAR